MSGPSPAPGSQPGFPANTAAASSAEKDPSSRVWETAETSSGHADTGRKLQPVTNCHPNNSFLWNKSHQPPAAAGSRALYQTPSKVKKITIVSDEDEEELYDDVRSHNSELYDDVRRPLSQSAENLTKPGAKSPGKLSASADTLLEVEVYDDVGDLRPVSSCEAAAQFAEAPVLVTARPAVVVDTDEDSLGAEQQLEAETSTTLYESIAGSLLRLDKLEVSNHLHAVSRLLRK